MKKIHLQGRTVAMVVVLVPLLALFVYVVLRSGPLAPVAVTLAKVEELREIMGYGVMSTPGVVIDGKVVHAGGVPSRGKVEQWLVA